MIVNTGQIRNLWTERVLSADTPLFTGIGSNQQLRLRQAEAQSIGK